MKGRIGALIALGAGFHPHFTGRENIYLNGAILGMDSHFITSRLARIVEFAEIGDFLEAPVSTYSSGMRVRLAFGVVTSFGSDIMLIDEIIGVGDARFLKKASQRIRARMEESKIVVLASHAEFVLKDFCDKGIVLHEGRIITVGNIDEAIEEYNKTIVRPYWASLSQ